MSAARSGRLVVFASGAGTNLQALLDACASQQLKAQVVLVVVNHPRAGAIARAAAAAVPVCLMGWPETPGEALTAESRWAWEQALCDAVQAASPELLVLAGWDRLLIGPLLSAYPSQIINLHPALPGVHPGLGAIERAHRAFAAGGPALTGAMVHRVTLDLDAGPVIAQETIPMVTGESLAQLRARFRLVEHRLLVQAVAQVLAARGVRAPSAPADTTAPTPLLSGLPVVDSTGG